MGLIASPQVVIGDGGSTHSHIARTTLLGSGRRFGRGILRLTGAWTVVQHSSFAVGTPDRYLDAREVSSKHAPFVVRTQAFDLALVVQLWGWSWRGGSPTGFSGCSRRNTLWTKGLRCLGLIRFYSGFQLWHLRMRCNGSAIFS